MRGLPGCRACSRNCRVVFTSISSSVNPIAALELELSRVQRPSAEGTSRFLPPKSPTSPFPPSVASVAALICAGVGFATSNILYRLQNTADTDRNQPEALKGADGQLGGSIRGESVVISLLRMRFLEIFPFHLDLLLERRSVLPLNFVVAHSTLHARVSDPSFASGLCHSPITQHLHVS